MTCSGDWQRLAAALSARPGRPPLVPERPWPGGPAFVDLAAGCPEGSALGWAAAVIADRPEEALELEAADGAALRWRAVALRRAGRIDEARRAFRRLGARAEDARLLEAALGLLRAGGPGFRWANEAAAHLEARGRWDPIWFVDACAAACRGLLSRETAALLEEIQFAELQLLLGAGAAGQA